MRAWVPWSIGVALAAVPALVLTILGQAFQGSGSASLARFDAAEKGQSGERVVSGVVTPRASAVLLVAPASAQRCVAWETTVSVAFPEARSDGEEETRQRILASGGKAVPFELVVDGEALAVIDEPRLELRNKPAVFSSPEPPGWMDALTDPRGVDSTHPRRWYESREFTPLPQQTVTVLGTPRAGDRLSPSPGDAQLVLFSGSLAELRERAHTLTLTGRWLSRAASALGVLAVALGLGLLRALRRGGVR